MVASMEPMEVAAWPLSSSKDPVTTTRSCASVSPTPYTVPEAVGAQPVRAPSEARTAARRERGVLLTAVNQPPT